MKLSKGQGICCFVAVILFGIFTTVSFLLPLEHTASFWLGYFFALLALVILLLSLLFFFEKSVKEDRALNIPLIVTAWLYLVIQAGLSFKEMTIFPAGYTAAVGINLILALLFTVIILSIAAVSSKIAKREEIVREKVSYIRDMRSQLERISTDDSDLKTTLKKLAEDVRYSDPMSHSQLSTLEEELKSKVEELTNSTSDIDKSMTICTDIVNLLKERNDKCKSLKGVKDPVENISDKPSGNKLAIVGVGVTILIFAVTLFVVFITVPTKAYNAACSLMEAGQYDEATAAFEALDGFKDSEKKIEDIKTILLDKDYDAAVALVTEEKYDEATRAFEELGEYRDSKAKIEEIKIIVLDKDYEAAIELMNAGDSEGAIAAFEALGDYRDSTERIKEIADNLIENKYLNAEKAFNKGDYATALEFYNELGDYKEAKARIEEISNRLSNGNVIYFGSYNDAPIAWKIVKREDDKILLLASESIKKLPLTSSLSVTAFKDSSIVSWLRDDFLEGFDAGKLDQICDTDGMKAFLLDKEAVKTLIDEKVDISAEDDWWITTSSETGFMFVSADGTIDEAGDIGIREKGIRPAIWLKLK